MKIKFILVLLALSNSSSAATWRGKVIEILDGDQVRVHKGRTELLVRLYGVDAPELKQPFGEQARQYLADALLNKVVVVEPAGPSSRETLTARVRIGQKVINEELLKAGLAWHNREHDQTKFYEEMEREARGAGRGLWAVIGRIPPWKWRGDRDPETPPGVLMGTQIKDSYGTAAVDVTSPVTGNVQTKVYHWFTCEKAHCKSCTALYKTEKAARAAGYRPHRACMATDKCEDQCVKNNAQRAESAEAIQARCRVRCKASPSRGTSPAPPQLPWSKELTCKRDRDCVFAYSPCSRCPACSPRWREVSNRLTYQRRAESFARRRVKCARCRPCPANESHWLGTQAVCIKEQCQPR